MKIKSLILSLLLIGSVIVLTSASAPVAEKEEVAVVKHCGNWQMLNVYWDRDEEVWYEWQRRTCTEEVIVIIGYQFGLPISEVQTVTTTEYRRHDMAY